MTTEQIKPLIKLRDFIETLVYVYHYFLNEMEILINQLWFRKDNIVPVIF